MDGAYGATKSGVFFRSRTFGSEAFYVSPVEAKKCCAELFISEVAHFHHLSSLSFFVQISLSNTHPFSSSILFVLILATTSRLPHAFTACAISAHYRARKLCESSAQQAVRTLSHA